MQAVSSKAVRDDPPSKLASVVSGSMSGALISACVQVQPFDVVRTRMQGDAIHGMYRSTFGTFKIVLAESGARGLWRGTSATVTRLALGAGAHFFFLDQLKPVFETVHSDGRRSLSATGAALTGGLSRAIASAVLCPITVVKTKMEATGTFALGANTNIFTVAKSVVAKEGVKGLWRGAVPTVLSNAPFSAIYYSMYTEIKRRFSTPHRTQIAVNLSAGLVAAMTATLVTQPGDVIRSRIQLGAGNSTAAAAAQTYQGGLRAVMSGTMPRFLKRSLQTALVWTLYEELLPVLTTAFIARQQSD